MKSMFNGEPSRLKYDVKWEPDIALNFISKIGSNSNHTIYLIWKNFT